MATVNLTAGNHIIEWSLDGYETIIATINISSEGIVSCISVVTRTCAEVINIVGLTITGLLKSIVPDNFDNWIISKGGYEAITGNLSLMGEFIDGYFGLTNLGFTPTLLDMGTFIDYYFGVI